MYRYKNGTTTKERSKYYRPMKLLDLALVKLIKKLKCNFMCFFFARFLLTSHVNLFVC